LGAAPDKKYNGDSPWALTDGLTGTDAFHDGRWCGFYGNDFDMTIDLGSMQPIQSVSLHWLEAEGSWIYLPLEMWVAFSSDGENWARAGTLYKDGIAASSLNRIKPVGIPLSGISARYVRVFAKNQGQHPVYPDGKCWLFLDELRIE
jgi:F5/8 type C domain